MVRPPQRPIPKTRTGKALRESTVATAQHRVRRVGYNAFASAYRFLPLWVIRLLPFIREDVRDLLRRRKRGEEIPEDTDIEILDTPPQLAEVSPSSLNPYPKYRCTHGNPLFCPLATSSTTAETQVLTCLQCGFPAFLATKSEIIGNQGRYRIVSFIGSRGLGRLYQAVQTNNNKTVIIKEYLLPQRHFNPQEQQQTKTVFENVAGLVPADGRVQDFRLLVPSEAIADRHQPRCYTVTPTLSNSYPTLRTYMRQFGAMTPQQVLHLLDQILQSLEALHTQKYRLPSGQIRESVAHGNLSLDTILILPIEQHQFHRPQFIAYIADLALTEKPFQPGLTTVTQADPKLDLTALGAIAFDLLKGNWQHDLTSPVDVRGQTFRYQFPEDWPENYLPLQQFILRLLGFNISFENAKAAREALPKLSEIDDNYQAIVLDTEDTKPPFPRLWLLLLLLLAFLGGIGIWRLLYRPYVVLADHRFSPCCIKDIAAIPKGTFSYTAEENGVWNYSIRQRNLVEKGKTLESELQQRIPNMLKLVYKPQPTTEKALAKVRNQEADFAITSLIQDLDRDLNAIPFAYDGLVVFVAFSYQRRQNSLPHNLNGQISIKQLRQLYTGEINNWKQLGGPDLPVQLYIPTDGEAIRIFEERVLQNDRAIAQFRRLWQKPSSDNFITTETNVNRIRQIPTFQAMRTVLQDFEERQIGSLSFGPLSQVFQQCSVYPLAIVEGLRPAVQPLSHNNESITPGTDLCNDKGSYYPSVELFQTGQYPLAYSLAVVYSFDNSLSPVGQKFAEILKTEEAQNLLIKTGLVPLQNLSQNR
ncbi:MAG: substrate-binding domain-containing protein [Arthrospira platensis PCC 7345]|uniref:substrate-binding domain-containing protein n=1 Tax=Limnospira platensis TaxID=118562 RepID=UPI0028E16A13|nr:substrate-binding domain-containing protein [Arthrospira platensis PCC 7345]